VKVADKVAIVTGGGNGIGGALAAKLAHTKYSRETSYHNLMEIFQKVMAA